MIDKKRTDEQPTEKTTMKITIETETGEPGMQFDLSHPVTSAVAEPGTVMMFTDNRQCANVLFPDDVSTYQLNIDTLRKVERK